MIQQFQFYVYPQKNRKQHLEELFVYSCNSNIIHNSQEVEATQMSIGRQTDKQNVVYMYTGILCSLKRKEILSNATEWMKLEDIE